MSNQLANVAVSEEFTSIPTVKYNLAQLLEHNLTQLHGMPLTEECKTDFDIMT